MENTNLTELFNLYEGYAADRRFSTAERICWQALEICGYKGPPLAFDYWLATTLRNHSANRDQLLVWANFLADTYYERGMYAEAEPIYSQIVAILMASKMDSGVITRIALPELSDALRKLAGAEAFLAKTEEARLHWRLADDLPTKAHR